MGVKTALLEEARQVATALVTRRGVTGTGGSQGSGVSGGSEAREYLVAREAREYLEDREGDSGSAVAR